MKLKLTPIFTAQSWATIMSLLLLAVVTGCGGSGDGGAPMGTTASTGGGSSGSTSATGGLTLQLVSGTNCPANAVTTTCPLTAKATLTDGNGKGIANSIVSFTNSTTLTVLSPSAGTALTDSSGVATVQVMTAGVPAAGDNGTAGTVTASAVPPATSTSSTASTTTLTASQSYSLGSSAVTLSIITPASSPFDLNAYGSTTIAAQVSSGGSVYKAQPVTVTFSSNCVTNLKATLPSSATTINGVAIVTYTDQGCGTTDQVTASVNGSTASVVLNIASPAVGSINFVSATPSDASIVFQGSGGSGRTSSAILTFEVVDTTGAPKDNVSVAFSNNNPSLATLGNSTGVTGSNGQVSTTVTAVGPTGSVYPAAGTLAVTASTTVVGSVVVSAISSNVIVSTGVPIQAAMSMVPAIHDLEGIDYFSAKDATSVNFFLSDVNGNPVVDGTPVAATTNEGGISGASGSNPGCTTKNGQCSLTFTAQNPVWSAATGIGIATVTGTSTNNTTTPLSESITMYLSGSTPYFYIGNTWVNPDAGGSISLGSCKGTIYLKVSDQFGNPLGTGGTVSATDPGSVVEFNTVGGSPFADDGRTDPSLATFSSPSTQIANYAALITRNNTYYAGLQATYGAGLTTLFNQYVFARTVGIPYSISSGCPGGNESVIVTFTNPNSGITWDIPFNLSF